MMSTMADNVIAAGFDNRPPMLDRSQYDSWQSRMFLYIQGKEHGNKLFQSVKEGPFQNGTITDPATETSPATTRARTMDDFLPEEKIRETCDIKATNIILQGLPPDSIESPIALVILSDTEFDPSKDSPSSDHALVAPAVSPFLSDDHSEFEPLEDLSEKDAPEPHEAIVARWRADVVACSSSSASTPPTSFQLVPASPSLPRRPAILVRPGQEIPFGQPYRTHPNGVLRMLTVRKRVHPFPACIPANYRRFRYVSSSPSPFGNEGDNGNRGGNGNRNGGGNGNLNDNNNNGNGNHVDNVGGAMQATHECTYKKILNCQPLNFKGTEEQLVWKGGLKRWNTCFTSITIHQDVRFQELSLLCPKMAPEEEDKIKRFVWGLPDNIQGNVTSFALTRFQDAVRMASSLMDQKVRANAARQADNKIKWNNHSRDNHVHRQPFKRTNVARAYTAGSNEKSPYYGSLPYCNKCKLHYTRPCTVKYGNCKKVGHMLRDCKTPVVAATATGNQRTPSLIRGLL
ncbi:hypothetical protein Tco_0121422 [Tanacetum coccineum]